MKFEDLKFTPHTYTTSIKEFRLDSFGHVNNAQYMMLYEEARWEMITSRGYGLKEVLDNQISTVVLEANIRYRKELKNREPIQIYTHVTGIDRLLVRLKQQIIKEDQSVASEALFTMGCFDLKQRKLISPTNDWLIALGKQK